MSERQLIFENLKRLADLIVQTFGRNCEAVVHDLQDMEHSLNHIAGIVTKRKPGGSDYRPGAQGIAT